eukprot:1153379-Pelagomonas_calceolata.AAC.7
MVAAFLAAATFLSVSLIEPWLIGASPALQQQVRSQQLALVDDPHAHQPTISLGSLLSHYAAKQLPQEAQR